ncbi:MAG TPA: TIGR03087 family PEP-CTERM/XrtA system glycosyltransferase [Burkholderiales bacterium]|nr:TIGR03087 family PEP-CTERM/XrtA system glycosyltransferase [Burkholderiales bacterium]
MQPLLFLAHRIPFPPNKGDKLRSYRLLRYLAERYRVYLGSFIDDPADTVHLDELRRFCSDLYIPSLSPRVARLASLRGLLTGEALSLTYYRHGALAKWVRRCVREHDIKKAVVFSSVMAQYVQPFPELKRVVDMVDVDSAKWTAYAAEHQWPMSWLYAREGKRLLAFEREMALASDASYLVTGAEVKLFESLAPDARGRVQIMSNGVDAAYFSPDARRSSPFEPGIEALVFTGAMDYWPNVDAVVWFAEEILPALRIVRPTIQFFVVGMRPTAAVQALGKLEGVTVTGGVPDVRPYLQHAHLVVAPLRIARGVQNKVLEAMAMEKAVIASKACASGVDAIEGLEYETAADAGGFVEKTLALLNDAARVATIGRAARARVLADYDWDKNLSPIQQALNAGDEVRPSARVVRAMASPV